MNYEDFIHQNVKSALIKQGFDPAVAWSGADKAVEQYRTHSSSSRKGKVFDDCFDMAKAWATKLQPKKKK